MSIPAAIYRRIHLYSVVPELEAIDVQIGQTNKFHSPNFSVIQSNFNIELSNIVARGEDTSSFYLGALPRRYMDALEELIIESNCASGTTLSNLIQQKISLLEAAYSNLTSNNN